MQGTIQKALLDGVKIKCVLAHRITGWSLTWSRPWSATCFKLVALPFISLIWYLLYTSLSSAGPRFIHSLVCLSFCWAHPTGILLLIRVLENWKMHDRQLHRSHIWFLHALGLQVAVCSAKLSILQDNVGLSSPYALHFIFVSTERLF